MVTYEYQLSPIIEDMNGNPLCIKVHRFEYNKIKAEGFKLTKKQISDINKIIAVHKRHGTDYSGQDRVAVNMYLHGYEEYSKIQ